MHGKTIAESQRLARETQDVPDVERKIDAKMPKPEQGQNVRSRKTSHYLGLFKENEQQVKKDKPQDGPVGIGEGHGDNVAGMFLLASGVHVSSVCIGIHTITYLADIL